MGEVETADKESGLICQDGSALSWRPLLTSNGVRANLRCSLFFSQIPGHLIVQNPRR